MRGLCFHIAEDVSPENVLPLVFFWSGEDFARMHLETTAASGSSMNRRLCRDASWVSQFEEVECETDFWWPFALEALLENKYQIRTALFSRERFRSPLYNYSEARPFFLAYMQSHCVKARDQWFQAISDRFSHRGVHALGHCPKHKTVQQVPKEVKDSHDTSIMFAKYRFVLCMENSRAPGYLTEKLFAVLGAGGVPIFDGSRESVRLLGINESLIIFLQDFFQPEDLFMFLDKLDSSPLILQELASSPVSDFTQQEVCNRLSERQSTNTSGSVGHISAGPPHALLFTHFCPDIALLPMCLLLRRNRRISRALAIPWANRSHLTLLPLWHGEWGTIFTSIVQSCFKKTVTILSKAAAERLTGPPDILLFAPFPKESTEEALLERVWPFQKRGVSALPSPFLTLPYYYNSAQRCPCNYGSVTRGKFCKILSYAQLTKLAVPQSPHTNLNLFPDLQSRALDSRARFELPPFVKD
eukprot:g19548.t1